ncbi:MAG: D-glycero-D-manno-heptose 1-phosphate guanosyltransferase [Proteobacteria bacterium]|nr:MAG: D-glycero-D-manno-heptose 1-phosphate guanosyltransferase [Pseudomonadota bacterium]
MEAIVLAGGSGTRLRSVVRDVPKPMAPVNGKPFLEYIMRYLQKNEINRVVLSVGYKRETIQEYFGNFFENLEIVYSVENEPLGTGGAIKKAMQFIKSEQAYIIHGDTFFNVNLKSLTLDNGSKLILSLKQMTDFDRYGCVEFDSKGYVITFVEKGYKKIGNVNGGVYLASKTIFELFDTADKFSFEDFICNNIQELKLTSKVFDEYFIDIGIPHDFKKAQIEMRNQL